MSQGGKEAGTELGPQPGRQGHEQGTDRCWVLGGEPSAGRHPGRPRLRSPGRGSARFWAGRGRRRLRCSRRGSGDSGSGRPGRVGEGGERRKRKGPGGVQESVWPQEVADSQGTLGTTILKPR
ncbi:hypothetical protein NN561_011516 [Cricetulus griseus]